MRKKNETHTNEDGQMRESMGQPDCVVIKCSTRERKGNREKDNEKNQNKTLSIFPITMVFECQKNHRISTLESCTAFRYVWVCDWCCIQIDQSRTIFIIKKKCYVSATKRLKRRMRMKWTMHHKHTHTIWGKMWTLNQYGENSQRSRDVKEDERRAEQ